MSGGGAGGGGGTGGVCPRCGLSVASGGLALCPRCLLRDDEPDQPGDAGGGGAGLPVAPPGLVLEAEIGRGGMGRVFRALHVRLDRPVAVKLLPPELAAEPSFEARFAREARALARLVHPHIVGVHDFGATDAGDSYLVMELVPGGTLAARLPLPPAEAVRVAIEVCQGLAYAHDKGLVHRDIKPENILFDGEGRAKIADFGIARLVDPGDAAAGGPPVTRASLVLGTPAYMAPEARAGAAPDPRMDVYAVGVLIHQMITGDVPAPRGASGGAAASAGSFARLPAPLAPVVRRALTPDPRDRWPSASALGAALAGAAAQLATTVAPAAGARPTAAPALPPEEQSWLRAVALALAGATAVALYAFLVSVTPRTVDAGDALPFVAFGTELRPDGRVFTRARFETFATLAAAGAFAVALAAYGLLRRHWREAGLDIPTPDRPLPATRAVLSIAALNLALFIARALADRTGNTPIRTYIPVLGGISELAMVYCVWLAVLESRRTSRPLRREPLLWIGVAVSLFPPFVSFARMMMGRAP